MRVETQVRRFRQLETEGEGGEFWYGLVARASADPAAPGKATSYLAFVVNPETSQWRVYVHQADGTETTVATSTQAIPATARLRIDMSGDEYTFWIGNTQVLPRQPIPGLTGGGVGFVLQLAPGAVEKHMHFELLRVANLAG